MDACWRATVSHTLDACPKSAVTARPKVQVVSAAAPDSVTRLSTAPPNTKSQARNGRRASSLIASALALLALALVVRVATEAAPAAVLVRAIATSTRFPGPSPVLAWPRQGESALLVQDVGSMGSAGRQRPVPIASVAKVMTAYLTLLEHPLTPGEQGFTMTITPANVREQKTRAAQGQSTVAVKSGERLSERQALQALLIPSANNIAALLAAHDPGGVDGFVAEMNATAKQLGMRSTTYTDPSGFQDSTVSTAADQLKLVQFAMRERSFAEIVDQGSVELPVAGRVLNFNRLVGREGYVGVKTGSDEAAGGCLVFAKRVVLDGRTLTVLGVVLGQRGGALVAAALNSARRLGDSASAALRVETVLPRGATVLRVSAPDGRRLNAITSQRLQAVGWGGLEIPLRLIVHSRIGRPRAGEILATLGAGDPRSPTVQVLAAHSLGGASLGWRLRNVFG